MTTMSSEQLLAEIGSTINTLSTAMIHGNPSPIESLSQWQVITMALNTLYYLRMSEIISENALDVSSLSLGDAICTMLGDQLDSITTVTFSELKKIQEKNGQD